MPHFNPTAFLLEGGILAVIGWIILHLWPVLRLIVRVAQRRADLVQLLAMLAGTTMLVVSLSLNVPHVKQILLWAGAAWGALGRSDIHRYQKHESAVSANPEALYGNILK